MTSKEIFDLEEKYILKTYGRRPIALEKGEGVWLFDYEGNRYLDFFSGLGVNGLGHSDPDIIKSIKAQSEKLLHVTNLFHIGPQAKLARDICEKSFADKVFFCNSGTEAVEGAIKFARKWGKGFKRSKWEFIAFRNSFHGRTLGSLSATIQEKYQKDFYPLIPGFRTAEFNDIESLKSTITDETVGIIIEPLQGEGGVNLATGEFLREVKKICDERVILLVFDEVQCGLGRMGSLFAYQYSGIVPDILTLAKPLAGGLPIGAVLVSKNVADIVQPGDHAATFGGNPFVTAVGLIAFAKLSDPSFLQNVRDMGSYLSTRLAELQKKHSQIIETRGIGLLQAVKVEGSAVRYLEALEKRNILISTAGPDIVRFIPPLIIDRTHVDMVMDTFDESLKEIA